MLGGRVALWRRRAPRALTNPCFLPCLPARVWRNSPDEAAHGCSLVYFLKVIQTCAFHHQCPAGVWQLPRRDGVRLFCSSFESTSTHVLVLVVCPQVFGNSPDETAYARIMLNREAVGDAMLMLQPTLYAFTFNGGWVGGRHSCGGGGGCRGCEASQEGGRVAQ